MMNKADLRGKVQTVLGLVDPEVLGKTLIHEHIACDLSSALFRAPEAPLLKKTAYAEIDPFSPEYQFIKFYSFANQSNVILDDEQLALKEVMRFKNAGGGTINEATSVGAGRNPELLARVSKATGVNIISGTGFYMCPQYVSSKSEGELEEEVVKDILAGMGDTEIRAGAINEISVSNPLTDEDRKVLRACAAAQKCTGASMSIHVGPPFSVEGSGKAFEYVESLGVDPSRVILCHIDGNESRIEQQISLLKEGCNLAYDCFGKTDLFPSFMGAIDMLSDARRMRSIAELLDKGYVDQIVISHDFALKTQMSSYGGWGYGYILEFLQPQMIMRGINEQALETILVDNPKRLLTFP